MATPVSPIVIPFADFDRVSLVASEAIEAGQFCLISSGQLALPATGGSHTDEPAIAGVALDDIASGKRGLIIIGGVIKVSKTKAAGSGTAIVIGAPVYADAQTVTGTDANGVYTVGKALSAHADDATSIVLTVSLWSSLRQI